MVDELVTFDAGSENGEGAVTLNIRKKHFGEFIQSLLGEPRRVEKDYRFTFVIDLAWLANLDDVLMQRITQQHQARLIDFQSTVYFRNGMKKTVPSRDAFRTFADNSQAETTGVMLTWVFLVQFPHSKIPERQAIHFKAHSSRPHYPEFSGALFVEVEHTEITWGDDILNHIDGQIMLLHHATTFLESASRKIELAMASAYTTVLYFAAVWIILFLSWKKHIILSSQTLDKKLTALQSQSSVDAISAKLDIFIEAIANVETYVIVVALEFVIFAGLYLSARALSRQFPKHLYKRSFVILNSASRGMYETYLEHRRNLTWGLVTAFMINVLAALFLNPFLPYLTHLFNSVFEFFYG